MEDGAYLEATKRLSFEDREWTSEADRGDGCLPLAVESQRPSRSGIYTTYCEHWYPEHREIMLAVARH